MVEEWEAAWSVGAAGGQVLYVGKAKNLRKRVLSYLSPSLGGRGGAGGGGGSARIEAMVRRATQIDFVVTPGGEHDALLLEARLIKALQPAYNVVLRDDKFYPYICVSLGDALPRVFSVPSRPGGHPTQHRYL